MRERPRSCLPSDSLQLIAIEYDSVHYTYSAGKGQFVLCDGAGETRDENMKFQGNNGWVLVTTVTFSEQGNVHVIDTLTQN